MDVTTSSFAEWPHSIEFADTLRLLLIELFIIIVTPCRGRCRIGGAISKVARNGTIAERKTKVRTLQDATRKLPVVSCNCSGYY